MQFNELKDANGTSLQSYAETLVEKCREAGLTTLIVFAKREDNNVDIHTVTNIQGSPSRALLELGAAMSNHAGSIN